MRNFITPFPLTFLSKKYASVHVNYLDVGCGNHMPTATKTRFPTWNYYGVDREDYNLNDLDKSVMQGYYKLDLTVDTLVELPDSFFDIVVISHVIEHLPNGLNVLSELAGKLKTGGRIFIEFPSERSLALPSMTGTLNFCDDSTHVRVYSVREVANLLLAQRFRIIKAGVRRQKIRIFLLPIIVAVKFILRRRLEAGDFWDITGFAEYVYAEKLG